jgi:hypothetical protein
MPTPMRGEPHETQPTPPLVARRPARTLHRPATPDWVNAGSGPDPAPLDEVQPGCGWFDSSHELNRGLQVTEHLTPERVANEVPLGWWLDWQSSGAGPSADGGRRLC